MSPDLTHVAPAPEISELSTEESARSAAERRAIRVAELDGFSLDALRVIWRERYGAVPSLRSPELLGLMLAWRIQLAAEGGLDRNAKLALRRKVGARAGVEPVAGARLVREWQGSTYEVVVMADGSFVHAGETFGSLSQIARKITGVRWNGPRFFGLRSKKVAA